MNTGQFILAVLRNTPWWTWALLAFLIAQGVLARRPGHASLTRLSIIPIIFLVWGLWSVFARFHGSGLSIGVWLASFALGLGFGVLRTAPLNIPINQNSRTFELPGSPMPLVSALLVFAIKYSLAVASAVHSDIRSTTWFLVADVGVTGLVAGLFAGRLLSLWLKYRSAVANNPAII